MQPATDNFYHVVLFFANCEIKYFAFSKCWKCHFRYSQNFPWGMPIEIIDIECGLLSRVSEKIVATKWRIYKGKINSPQDFCYKNNVRNIQNGGFIRAKSGPLSRDRARILYLLILWACPSSAWWVADPRLRSCGAWSMFWRGARDPGSALVIEYGWLRHWGQHRDRSHHS